ncbi:H/ACA ribonucleoprotein complex non-core subunit NAF1 [Heliangelus exortis]|uniref:H/ACA ribonucleoprotein complex non-core subunit NAF1 n=1 Tax=Heliangelus exortis TaxID=472823 RepID=UPI003A8FD173
MPDPAPGNPSAPEAACGGAAWGGCGAQPSAGMEAQGEVMAQLRSLAFESPTARPAPGEEQAEITEGLPGEKRAASMEELPVGEAVVRMEELPGEKRAASMEELTVGEAVVRMEELPGEKRAASMEELPVGEAVVRMEELPGEQRAPVAPSGRKVAGEERAPPPPAEGSRSSPMPAGPNERPAAAPSSDSESDTDSDSSSTTSSSSSCLSSAVSDEDDHPNEKDNISYCVKTKDELPVNELPPVEDLSIILTDDVELKLFGTVSSIIEQLVIIESQKGLPPVNEESIIFKEDRQAAGRIFEVFGPVLHPFYVIRFNSPEHIKAKDINVQDRMYFAPSVEDFTQYIFAEKLKQEKGSDASWKNDQEPPPEVLDFSDDEKEREAKQKKKKPQNQGKKKLRSETNATSEDRGYYQSRQPPASGYSRGYHSGFSRAPCPPPSGPPGFLRPQVQSPQLCSSDNRIHQESPVFPQPYRRENPMMQQYTFPPPAFGSVNDMHQFQLPPPNPNMLWTGLNMYNSYPFLPPPLPPPPPSPDSYQFRPC